MKFTSDVVVLSARRYSMTDEKTGELVQGTKVQYIEDWNDCMEQNKRGVSVLSANFPFKWFDDLPICPQRMKLTSSLQRVRAVSLLFA